MEDPHANNSTPSTAPQPPVTPPQPTSAPVQSAPAPAYAPAHGHGPTGPHTGPSGIAITALVLGILAFISGWVPFFGLLVGIAAIIFSIIALKKPGGKTFGIIGIIGGILGALTGLIVGALFIVSLTAARPVIDQANKAIEQEQQRADKIEGAKKDFAKGEAAVFGDFEVTINSVQRNFSPSNSYMSAGEGKELVVLNVTAKNISSSQKMISSYDFKVNDNGTSDGPAFSSTPSPEFDSKTLDAGTLLSGNMVFEVKKDATNLKLTYSAYTLGGQADYSLAF